MAQLGPKSVNNTPRLSVGSGVFGLKGSKGGTPSQIPYSQYGSSIGELCIFLQATCSCGYTCTCILMFLQCRFSC